MKILHLIDSGGLYGAEKMLLALVKEQVAQGFQPMILSAGEPQIVEKPLEAEAKRQGLPVTPWRMKPGFNLQESWRIIKWARNKGYELLHSHGYKFNVLIGMFPMWLRKLPLVATLHGYVHAKKFTKSWVYEYVDRRAIRRMQGTVVVSEAMVDVIPHGFRGQAPFTVIHNGLDVEGVKLRSREKLDAIYGSFYDSHSPIILGVGRLSPEKGFERTVNLLAQLKNNGYPDAGLVIVGEGRLRRQIEALAEEKRVREDLLLPGYCSNVPGLMVRSDLFIISSYTEGLPISLLESMAVGLPLLSSPVGEIPAVLGECKGKVLSDFSDIERVVMQAKNILENKSLNREIVGMLQERVSQDYSVTTMTEKYTEFYQHVMGFSERITDPFQVKDTR